MRVVTPQHRVHKTLGKGTGRAKVFSTEPIAPKTIEGEILECLEATIGKYPTCSARFLEFCNGKDKFLAADFAKKKDMLMLFLERYGFKTEFNRETATIFFGKETIHVMGRTDVESVMGIFDPAFSRLEPEIL